MSVNLYMDRYTWTGFADMYSGYASKYAVRVGIYVKCVSVNACREVV